MKTSIALCACNGERFLEEQLQSFLKQTKLPDEIVVCDDLSTDSTREILKKFQAQTSFPVQIEINNERLGVIKNFENAISLCKGDLIFLADQDDVWLPEKIEIITEYFKENENLGLVFTDAELINEKSEKLQKTLFDETFKKRDKDKHLFDLCLNKNVVTGATMAFRSKHRRDFLPIPTSFAETLHDGWIAMIISAIADYECLEIPLIHYRQHEYQRTGLFGKTYQDSIQKLNKEIAFLEKLPDHIENRIFLEKIREKKELIGEIILGKKETIKHYEARMNLHNNRLKRIIPIFSEFTSGRYAKFSNGIKSVLKDLLENSSNLK